VQRTVDAWGRIDLLVNNAQTKVYQSLRRMTEADMQTMWQSGPMACLRFMQTCFPYLRETAGCVINMGSGSSIMPRGAMGGYAMTKEAVRVLSRVGAVEWGRFGIRVNAVCPLAVTPGLEEFDEAAPGASDELVTPQIPLGRWGEPEADIGRAVVYLASRDGGYITGTTLMVDGGYNYLR
jgi:NAD(P)-dependent dehydrogenase (short-subunit alcohol dehydrogenase family)